MTDDRHARRGAALVELLASFTLASVITAAAVGLVGTVLHVERSGRRHSLETSALARLARDFRRDAAAARAAAPAPGARGAGAGLNLELTDAHQVEYRLDDNRLDDNRLDDNRLDDNRLVRREHMAGALVRQELYELPPRFRAEFVLAGKPGMLLALRLVPPEDQSAGAGRASWRVEAGLGRDRRFRGAEQEATAP